jgi:hypothetical protein
VLSGRSRRLMHAARSVGLGIWDGSRQRISLPSRLQQGRFSVTALEEGARRVGSRRRGVVGTDLTRHVDAAGRVLGIRGPQTLAHTPTALSNSTQQQQPTQARKSITMAATATHHTSFLIRPAYRVPEFIPFDPSRLAVKRP